MKIGYSKVGRSWKLDPHAGVTGSGDIDVVNALKRLAALRPDDTFYLLGRNSGELPQDVGYPGNVINPWVEIGPILKQAAIHDNATYVAFMEEHMRRFFVEMDEHIVWAGQHGASNSVIPKVEDRTQFTSPQDSMQRYAGFIIDGVNHWRDAALDREEIWLCPDVRNYVKCRDLKWPLRNTVIAQFDWANKTKHERYGDTTDPSLFSAEWASDGVWYADARYSYNSLELTALDDPSEDKPFAGWDDRFVKFGMIVNENRAYVSNDRLSILQSYVLDVMPEAEIFGVWSKASMDVMGRSIRPCPSEHMRTVVQRWKTTLTTPASGSGWATAKPWEAFQNGTVCFFHPKYDTQNHILKDASPALNEWLRVRDAVHFRKLVEYVNQNREVWEWIVNEQYEYFVRKFNETDGGVREIMRRLDRAGEEG